MDRQGLLNDGFRTAFILGAVILTAVTTFTSRGGSEYRSLPSHLSPSLSRPQTHPHRHTSTLHIPLSPHSFSRSLPFSFLSFSPPPLHSLVPPLPPLSSPSPLLSSPLLPSLFPLSSLL